MKISTIIISTLCAAAAGVIAGTLIAPDKGYKTRRNLAKKGQDYKDYLKDNFDDLSDSISHSFETLEDETKRLSKKAKANAKEVKAMVN